jgi:cyclopropane fatty-acyl-phospholipid synthase-like methyltransferase
MTMETGKAHWESIYRTKQSNEVGWWQDTPRTSLDFIHSFNLPKTANIIDIGGGDSKLVDFLLAEGYENVTVLDISEHALARAQQRLGEKSKRVRWVVSDVMDYHPDTPYDVWHDRATFHFLTTEQHIARYLSVAREAVNDNGYVTIGTFSTTGPTTCSGLTIRQYSDEALTKQLSDGFERIRCITEDHVTPFKTTQNFLFCSFRRHEKRDAH